MKTEDQIQSARARLIERIKTGGLSHMQLALLSGMLNAIVWVADGAECSTFERVLSDEPMVIK